MSNTVLLSNTEHKDLKVDSRYSTKYGDNVNRTLAFATEFAELHKEYPILFHKTPESGEFHAHAILGFDKDENLFLGEDDWSGNYVPAILARGPFAIGFQERNIDGTVREEPVIHIDMDSPRVGADDGQPVFLPFGGDTPFLEGIMRTLQVIHQGAMLNKVFFETLESMDLLEPVSVEVKLSNVEQVNFPGYYTISGGRLSELEGDSLQTLNKQGILGLVFFAVSSLSNFQRLIELKNKKAALAE